MSSILNLGFYLDRMKYFNKHKKQQINTFTHYNRVKNINLTF